MKKKDFLWSILSILFVGMLSVCFTSCGGDDDDTIIEPKDEYDVVGTTWTEDHYYSSGSTSGTAISFTGTEAILTRAQVQGTQTLTDTHRYTYRRAKNLVVMTPTEAGKATLEGRIDESGIKMTLTNMSNNSVVAYLYKR